MQGQEFYEAVGMPETENIMELDVFADHIVDMINNLWGKLTPRKLFQKNEELKVQSPISWEGLNAARAEYSFAIFRHSSIAN